MKKTTMGQIIMVCGLLFATLETGYFGWNWVPKSQAEFICDLCASIVVVMGIALYEMGKRAGSKSKEHIEEQA